MKPTLLALAVHAAGSVGLALAVRRFDGVVGRFACELVDGVPILLGPHASGGPALQLPVAAYGASAGALAVLSLDDGTVGWAKARRAVPALALLAADLAALSIAAAHARHLRDVQAEMARWLPRGISLPASGRRAAR